MSEKLTVGQKLWKVSRFGKGWVEIVKVGRKWATLDNGNRIDVLTLIGESNFDGRCYLTKEEWDEAITLDRARSFLRRKITAYGRQPETTVENIEKAITLLGYDIAEFRAAISREDGER